MSACASITVDHDDPAPPFDQVRLQIIAIIRDGRLLAGQKLPTVRGLAHDLGIAANTVARAYKELEAAGIVEARGRSGTFVAAAEHSPRAGAERAAVRFVADLRSAGVPDEEIRALVAAALAVPSA